MKDLSYNLKSPKNLDNAYENFLNNYNRLISHRKKNKIKSNFEDFVVEEITNDGTILELDKIFHFENKNSPTNQDYLYFILQKKNWETTSALKALAKKLKVSYKRFSFAGTKDRKAITTQLCSIYKIQKEELLKAASNLKDIKINGCYYSSKKLELGELLGNRFKIKLEYNYDFNLDQLSLFSNFKIFPNFFGEQRFGNRYNSHIVGKLIIQNKLKEAILEFLCGNPIDNIEDAKFARIRLLEEQDFKKALQYFPKYLKHERRILDFLAKNQRDYTNALRKLPRQMLLMFVHSYQAYLFNEILHKRIEQFIKDKQIFLCENEYFANFDEHYFPIIEKKSNDNNTNGIPIMQILGYETKTLNDYEKEVLDRECIKLDYFKVKHFPELNSKGNLRPMLIYTNDFTYEEKNLLLQFSLYKGCYATTLLNFLYDINSEFFSTYFKKV
ncbi:MAG: tRNA pseudouridine(13) synthase TruD [Candidatus Anstonellales archaeon]